MDKEKRIVIYRFVYTDEFVVAVFPEISENNVAENMLSYSFRFGWIGVSEEIVRRTSISIKEHPDTPNINRHIKLLDSELVRSYDLERRNRLLRRYKLTRHFMLYIQDLERLEALKTPTNTI